MSDGYLFVGLLLLSSLKQLGAMFIALILIFFGYRLFYLIQSQTGDLEVESKLGKIKILRATPGIFLTFFGSAILIVTLLQHSTVEGEGANGAPLVAKFGANAAQTNSVDFKQCAKIVTWMRNNIVNSQEYVRAEGQARKNNELYIEESEILISQCVDSKFGNGSYRKYSTVQRDVDSGRVNDDADQNKVYTSVSSWLAD